MCPRLHPAVTAACCTLHGFHRPKRGPGTRDRDSPALQPATTARASSAQALLLSPGRLVGQPRWVCSRQAGGAAETLPRMVEILDSLSPVEECQSGGPGRGGLGHGAALPECPSLPRTPRHRRLYRLPRAAHCAVLDGLLRRPALTIFLLAFFRPHRGSEPRPTTHFYGSFQI